MITKKEITWIVIAIILMSFVINIFTESNPFYSISISLIIILVSIFSKKIASKYFNIQIEHKGWEFQRYGFYERAHFKKPFPIGLIAPFALTILSLGIIRPLTLLQFESKSSKTRVGKKRGMYRYQKMNESDPGFVAFWGFLSLILLSLVASLIKQPDLAKYSIYYGLWNLLPLGQLDGSRLFFGSITSWVLTIIIYIVTLIIVA